MTVKDWKELLAWWPDDTQVVLEERPSKDTFIVAGSGGRGNGVFILFLHRVPALGEDFLEELRALCPDPEADRPLTDALGATE